MIEKIKNYIEDNTSLDVTNNQVMMGLAVIGCFVVLILAMMFGSGGPQEDEKGVKVVPPSKSAPVHTGK